MLISKTNKTHQTSSANGDVLSSLDTHKSKDFSFLKQIKLKQVSFWDFTSNVIQAEATKYKFKLVKLSDLIAQRKGFFTIDDEKKYKRCKVQLYAKGVIRRDIVKGKEIKTKKQQACKKDDFLVAEIDAKVGGYGIVPSELENAVVSSHYYLYEIDTAKLLPEFLGLYVKTEEFAKQVKATGSTNYASIRPAQVLDYQIPLPPIETQEKLVADYNSQMSQADDFEAKAKALEQESETYLLKELGIKIQQTEKNDWRDFKFLQPANLKELSRWDFPFLMDSFEMNSEFPVRKLGEFIECFLKDENGNSLRFESSKFPKSEFNYLGMENVEKNIGEVANFSVLKGTEVKSQTLRVPKDFIIYGKLRPYLNKYWYNDTNLTNIICSSEFFAFNLKQNINLQFFLILLSSSFVQKQISNQTSGVRMPRMSENLFFSLEVPIPNDKKIQNKIVKHINSLKAKIKELKDGAENLRRNAKGDFEAELFEI